MLNHLDDPTPHEYPDDFRARVRGRARRLRRRRRVVGASTLALLAVVSVSAGLYARAFDRIDDVDRITVAGTGDPPVGDDRTLLVVGVDGRTADWQWTDTILVVRVADGRASVLSVPRDLAVELPGVADPIRMNSIASAHGFPALVEAIDRELGIDIDNLVQVGFGGFTDLVDLVGGIDVHVSAPVRDQMSGLHIDAAGCHRLGGPDALALARARHLQTFVDDRWRTDPTGDLGRIARQPALLAAGLQSVARTRPDPLTADRLAGWFADHAAVDDNLETDELIGLLRSLMQMDPDELTFTTVPVEDRDLPNGAAVLQLTPDARDAVDRWKAGVGPGPQYEVVAPCRR